MSTILDLQNITTTVNVGTSEEKNILKNINLKINDGDLQSKNLSPKFDEIKRLEIIWFPIFFTY